MWPSLRDHQATRGPTYLPLFVLSAYRTTYASRSTVVVAVYVNQPSSSQTPRPHVARSALVYQNNNALRRRAHKSTPHSTCPPARLSRQRLPRLSTFCNTMHKRRRHRRRYRLEGAPQPHLSSIALIRYLFYPSSCAVPAVLVRGRSTFVSSIRPPAGFV